MITDRCIKFKVATERWEFEQIHKLNYRTFVEEIPQHEPNRNKILIDKFHSQNKYLICLYGKNLIGMLAIRDKRPFSLDQKIEDLDTYLPHSESICEIRLLSIEKKFRNGKILKGLLTLLAEYGAHRGYDLLIITAHLKQMKLYKHFGFVPFGPILGKEGAWFQPMYMTPEAYKKLREKSKLISDRISLPLVESRNVNLLPGPVEISDKVKRAFQDDPVSHRSPNFIRDFDHTRKLLCDLVNSQKVELLMGSGSLSNDAIAAQLSVNFRKGLVLSNGEFGERLIDHATRFGINFERHEVEWGKPFNIKHIIESVKKVQEIDWLWAVHCETSTGVLNDIGILKEVCQEREIRLCLDCVSSIGTIQLDLRGVYLASGVSGKGLGAFPGLSMVFYNHDIMPKVNNIPRYIDLGLYAASGGIPFTMSSNFIYALKRSVKNFDKSYRYERLQKLSSWVREELRQSGFRILAPENHASPALITIALPDWNNSQELGLILDEEGYLISYRSEYLLKRNWIQISLMGEYSIETLSSFLEFLKRIKLKRVAY
ncbi:GNAT family N-acetyltransferase [Desulfobacterota bacterium AH_259_B03_O07]|nr:GNAT family N-acetyltransferase [Desulfobacterota bacterium AH_259_B03_O07]